MEPIGRRRSWKYGAKLALAWIVIALGVFAAGSWANSARLATLAAIDPASVQTASIGYEQLECLEKQIVLRVPAGTPIFIESNDEYWRQRLIELATPWLPVVATAPEARLFLDVRAGNPLLCHGTELVIKPA